MQEYKSILERHNMQLQPSESALRCLPMQRLHGAAAQLVCPQHHLAARKAVAAVQQYTAPWAKPEPAGAGR